MEFSMIIQVSLTFKLVSIIDLTLQNHFHYLEEVTLVLHSATSDVKIGICIYICLQPYRLENN